MGWTPGLMLRALRLPFCTASALPYTVGALHGDGSWSWPRYGLGLIAVTCTHLAANLLNDYNDSASGVDDQDPTYYGFFGGSKLIQEGRLPPAFYLLGGIVFSLAGLVAVTASAETLGAPSVVLLYLLVLFLAWSYTHPPLRLCYHRQGEATVFLLFGPATVLGGAVLMSGHYWHPGALWLSLPLGLFTAAVLIANEAPDAPNDLAGGKVTLVGWLGAENGWLLFLLTTLLAYALLVVAWWVGWVTSFALLTLLTLPLAFAAAGRIARDPTNKPHAVGSAKQVILLQTVVAVLLILERLVA